MLSHKKEWNTAICSNIDGPRNYLTKWSQIKRNIWYYLYVESKKSDTNEIIYKTEIDWETQRQTWTGEEGIN